MIKTVVLASVAALLSTAALAATIEHPTGLWVVTGTPCKADKLAGMRIDADSITMYDPGVKHVQSSSDGTSSVTDLSTQIGTITSVEKVDDGYRFLATLAEDQAKLDLTLMVRPNGDAVAKIPSKGSIPLTGCPA